MFLEAVFASFCISLISLIGVFVHGNNGHLKGTRKYIIPVAVGIFLSVTFFELIPETLASGGFYGSVAISFGFLGFYALSHILKTFHHHHHKEQGDKCEEEGGAELLLVGDSVHNFADGVIIAGAFLASPAIGVTAAIGIALHEIPQEITEYGVLIRAGYSRNKALLYNFISALSIIVGTVFTFVLAENAGSYLWIITGIAAGNLLYIGASDMLPTLNSSDGSNGNFWVSFITTIIGFAFMAGIIALIQ